MSEVPAGGGGCTVGISSPQTTTYVTDTLRRTRPGQTDTPGEEMVRLYSIKAYLSLWFLKLLATETICIMLGHVDL